jgi:hypothetical protein
LIAALIAGTFVEPRKEMPSGRLPFSSAFEAARPVVCVKGQFPFRVFAEPATAERGDDGPAAALRRVLAGGTGLPNVPEGGWRRLSVTAASVEFGHGDPPLLDGYVVLQSTDGEWKYEQSGASCIVRPFVADRLAAPWQLDPSEAAPGASSTSFQVRVNDTQCASGRSPEGRLREPQVRILPQAIVVTFTAERLDGFQTCPSHPSVTRTIRLPEPLGTRQLLDGATVPALPPCLRQSAYSCRG